MPTKEQAISVDQDSSTKSLGQSLDEAGKPTKFIFDVALSTAIAANGERQADSPGSQGSAHSRHARQDESLLARRELSLHRPDLPL